MARPQTMEKTKAKIFYTSLRDEDTAIEKRDWFANTRLEHIHFEDVRPDKSHNWVNLAEESDWETMIPVGSKAVKAGKSKEALFELFSLGVVTNRDEWVYDFGKPQLEKKIQFLIREYNTAVKGAEGANTIKWTRAIKNDLKKKVKYSFESPKVILSLYRPFVKQYLYYSAQLNEMQYQIPSFFGKDGNLANRTIMFTDANSGKPFMVGSSEMVSDLHFVGAGCGSEVLGLYRYDSSGNRLDNITDWGLAQFQKHYPRQSITKENIFHYVYAVLHNPAYRKKYELNLKREFPRIPFYEDFAQWVTWGKELMDLHIGYETVEPWPLELVTAETRPEMKKQKELFAVAQEPEALYGYQAKPKVKLKADKERGIIELDELSLLKGIPKEAWDYKLGNRSALEWILDQYKEKKPTDPTIAEKFNTYRFADYKDKVIDLLRRVCRVSMETVRIVGEMETSFNRK